MRGVLLEFDRAQRAEKQAEEGAKKGPKSTFAEMLEKSSEEVESPGEHVKKLLADNRAQAAEEERRAAEQDVQPKVYHSFFEPGDLTKPPGVVGELTDWIAGVSMFPSRKIAVLSSLGIVGTVGSHRVMTPTDAALNLIMAAFAESTRGKGFAFTAVDTALTAIGASRLVFSKAKSSVALIDELKVAAGLCRSNGRVRRFYLSDVWAKGREL